MGIDDRVQVEGSRSSEGVCGVQLQAMIVRRGEKGGRVKWVEAELCDAKFVR